MADEAPKTVTVTSIKWHTYDGQEYPVDAVYEIAEMYADSVVAQGMAIRGVKPPDAAPTP